MDGDVQAEATLRSLGREDYYAALRHQQLEEFARERTVNPRVEKQFDAIDQHTVFPFDRETPLSPAASTIGYVNAVQKIPLFASVNGVFIQYAVPVLATILIGAGVGLGIASVVNNMNVQNQVQTFATDAADSGQTDQSGAFVPSTDPRHPVKIEIGSLSITANTTSVGVNKEGNIGAPASIKELAWYEHSSSPADATGTALIVGHVGSPTYPGVLAPLSKVQNGSDVKVTMGDGKVLHYSVTGSEDVSADKISMSKYLQQPGQTTKLLNFITCSGDYNARTYTYTDRLIVTARAAE